MRTLHAPQVYIRNGWYYLQYWDASLKKQVKKSTAIRADAKDWKRSKDKKRIESLIATIERNRYGFRVGMPTVEAPKADILLSELLSLYNANNRIKRGEKAESTYRNRDYAITFVGDRGINTITEEYVLYLRDREFSPYTKQQVFNIMKMLFSYAIAEGYIKKNPFAGVLITIPKTAPKRVPKNVEMNLFRFLYSYKKDLFCQTMMLRLSGMRAKDICLMKPNVLIEEDGILVMKNYKKNERDEILPVTPAMKILLEMNESKGEYLFAMQSTRQLYTAFTRGAKKAGIPKIGLHQLKKNYSFEIAGTQPDSMTYDSLMHHAPNSSKIGVNHYSGKIYSSMLKHLLLAQSDWEAFLLKLRSEVGTK